MKIKTFFEVHAPVAGAPRRNTVFQVFFLASNGNRASALKQKDKSYQL